MGTSPRQDRYNRHRFCNRTGQERCKEWREITQVIMWKRDPTTAKIDVKSGEEGVSSSPPTGRPAIGATPSTQRRRSYLVTGYAATLPAHAGQAECTHTQSDDVRRFGHDPQDRDGTV